MHKSLAVAVAVLTLSPVAAMADDAASISTVRPMGNAVGIGLGYTFPQSILEPNTVSVRFKVGPVSLEPAVVLGGDNGSVRSTSSFQVGTGNPTESEDEDRSGGFGISAGTAIRYPLAQKGPLDLVAIGGLSFNYGSDTVNNNVTVPDTLDQTMSTNMGLGLNWGLGIEWFMGSGFAMSVDARNPFIGWSSVSSQRDVETGTGNNRSVTRTNSTSSGFDFGLTFQPTVRLQMHLYF